MRVVTVALAAIPVIIGGFGIAVVAGGVAPVSPFSASGDESHFDQNSSSVADSGDVTGSGITDSDSDAGTSIEGRRPHLSVIDGRANAFVPAPIPEVVSLLPTDAPETLAPLPRTPLPSTTRPATGSSGAGASSDGARGGTGPLDGADRSDDGGPSAGGRGTIPPASGATSPDGSIDSRSAPDRADGVPGGGVATDPHTWPVDDDVIPDELSDLVPRVGGHPSTGLPWIRPEDGEGRPSRPRPDPRRLISVQRPDLDTSWTLVREAGPEDEAPVGADAAGGGEATDDGEASGDGQPGTTSPSDGIGPDTDALPDDSEGSEDSDASDSAAPGSTPGNLADGERADGERADGDLHDGHDAESNDPRPDPR